MHHLPVIFPITFPVTCPQQSQVKIKQRHWHLFLYFISIKFESNLFHEHINSYLNPSRHVRRYQSCRISEKYTLMRSPNNFYNINIFLVVTAWVKKKHICKRKIHILLMFKLCIWCILKQLFKMFLHLYQSEL